MGRENIRKKPLSNRNKLQRRSWINRLLWIGFGIGVLAIVMMIAAANFGWLGEMPDLHEIQNPESSMASEAYDSKGELLGRYYYQNKIPSTYEELPQDLVHGLLSIEDERFYDHSGIDIPGLFSAMYRTIVEGRPAGASTITQQLAKNLFTKQRASNLFDRLIQKMKEWVIAVRLERNFTKEEIIALYFDNFDYLHNAIGIKSAAKTYFSKRLDELNTQECATLVAMLNNPAYYRPTRYPERTKERRNEVLNKMNEKGYLSSDKLASTKKTPIVVNLNVGESFENKAPYFVEEVRKEAMEILKGIEHPIFKRPYNIYKDGLKIYTTLDARMQLHAEEAVLKHLKNYQRIYNTTKSYYKYWPYTSMPDEPVIGPETVERIYKKNILSTPRGQALKRKGMEYDSILAEFKKPVSMMIFTYKGPKDTMMSPYDSITYYQGMLRAGFMAMEPGTGFVKAWVGGPDYRYFKYDMVNTGRRQVGSTFKPFVYATAVNQNRYSPCHIVDASRFTWGSWSLRGEGGQMPMKEALAKSLNPATARLIQQARVDNVIETAQAMGVTVDIPNNPTIALGSVEIPVKEMIGAYGTFANKGVYVKPVTILRIEDKNGSVIYDNVPFTREVFGEDIAYIMIKMLEGVTEYGTSKRLRGSPYNFKNEIAGKTGTTNNNSDAWFIGIVPNLVAGGWCAFEDRRARFRSTGIGQGAGQALPIWGYFMKACYADKDLNVSSADFEEPADSLFTIETDCGKYSQSNSESSFVDPEQFKNEHPAQYQQNPEIEF